MPKQDFIIGMRVQYSTSGGQYPKYAFAGLTGTVVERYFNRKGIQVRWDNGIEQNHSAEYLIPLDDVLPTVPDSTLYIKDGGARRLRTQITPFGHVGLKIQLDNRGSTNGVGYALLPDEALQVAHDLIRMAMKLKREQKEK